MISLNNNEYVCAEFNSVSIICLLSFSIYYHSEPFFGLNKISPKVLLKVPLIMSPIIHIFNKKSLFKNFLTFDSIKRI